MLVSSHDLRRNRHALSRQRINNILGVLRARAKRIIDDCCFIRLVTFIVITRFYDSDWRLEAASAGWLAQVR